MKNNLTKSFCLLFIIVLLVSVSACSSGSVGVKDNNSGSTNAATQQTETTVIAETTKDTVATKPPETTVIAETTKDTVASKPPETTVISEPTVPSESGQTYTNEEYGWSVQLPDGWYCINQEKGENYGVCGNTVFSSENNVGEEGFNIYGVRLGSEKDDKKSGVYFASPASGYLGENSEYAFYWSITGIGAQTGTIDTPNLIQNVKDIVKTFKLL